MKRNLPITNREKTYGDDVVIISTTDLKGVITYINQDFIDISGFSEEELIGKSHNIVRHPDMPPEAFQDLWDTVKAGDSWRGLVKNRCKNGDHYWVDAYVTPVYEHDKVVGYQSVRSRPTRQEVEKAQAIYDKLNSKQIRKLPRQRNILDISLRPRIFASLTILFLLAVLVAAVSVVQDNHQSRLLGRHGAELMQLQKDWQRFQDDPQARTALEHDIAALVTDAGNGGTLAQINHIATLSSRVIIAICITGLFAMWVIGWLLVRTVVKPVERVTTIARRIAGGDLTRSIEAHTHDEVGEMFQAMKLMQARLLTVLGRFNEATSNLIQMADDVSASSSRTVRSMQHQGEQTEQVATAVNEMAATVQEVARNTGEAADAAAGAETASKSGMQVVQTTREAIEALAREVRQTSEVIHKLEEDGDSITTVMGVIRAIAEQTNLLALNAAIEAARAGEQGRGFAVVADEVRNLAQRTQDATGEIEEVVQHLQSGIRNAVSVMETGQERAEATVEHAKRTAASLDAINRAVAIINDMNTQIAAAANQQSQVAEEINHNVVAINSLTEQTLGGAHEFTSSGATLAGMATRLQELLSQFNLGNRKHFDFDNARNAHLAWKTKLRALLDGNEQALDASQATSHRQCALGRWYYSDGLKAFGDIPEMRAIEAPHTQLHQIIHQIIDAKKSGRLDEAEQLYREVEPLSRTVVRLLDEVERKVDHR